jgi:hypothetical protein
MVWKVKYVDCMKDVRKSPSQTSRKSFELHMLALVNNHVYSWFINPSSWQQLQFYVAWMFLFKFMGGIYAKNNLQLKFCYMAKALQIFH